MVRDLKVKDVDLYNLHSLHLTPLCLCLSQSGALTNHMTPPKGRLKYEKIPIKMFIMESDTVTIMHCLHRLEENIVNWLFPWGSGGLSADQ